MGALGHYLEQGGIATTAISLIREHTEAIRPPRALWVPFELGRPFAVPHDAAFQRRVLIAVLRLLEAGATLRVCGVPDGSEASPSPAMKAATAATSPNLVKADFLIAALLPSESLPVLRSTYHSG
mgnify:CR=1 FL=1